MNDDNVLMWPGTTTHVLFPDRLTDAAEKADLKLCIIVGVKKNGDFYLASTDGDYGMVLWQLERAKLKLFDIAGGP